MADLRVTVDGIELDAAWTDENPDTREAIEGALPLEGDAARWGDELYFRTNVDLSAENAKAEVPVGTLAYWPQGNAVCLFWGPTPASVGDEPRAASPVNIFARVDGVGSLLDLDGGAAVRLDPI